jgi:tetratricopeptide (TPR) repeat protein
MDTHNVSIIQIMRDHAQSLREAGKLEEALESLNAAIEKAQQMLGPDQETIDAFAGVLEARANLYLNMGLNQEAVYDLKHAIDQLSNCSERSAEVGNLYATLGSAYDRLERYDRVTESWLEAVKFFEQHEPPLLLDVATISNNLGYMAKAQGDLNAAEDYFLKALNIMMIEYGQKHERTASVLNNLGAFYLAAGFPNQAREMHTIALETRRELFDENHPDTAQSHNNLALALLESGDRAWARRHFEKALAAFEALGVEFAEDIESVASNYCDFLRAEGEGNLADIIAGRTQELLGSNGANH